MSSLVTGSGTKSNFAAEQLVGFGTEEDMRREISRLHAWLEWLALDDPDAQRALEGEPAPGFKPEPPAVT